MKRIFLLLVLAAVVAVAAWLLFGQKDLCPGGEDKFTELAEHYGYEVHSFDIVAREIRGTVYRVIVAELTNVSATGLWFDWSHFHYFCGGGVHITEITVLEGEAVAFTVISPIDDATVSVSPDVVSVDFPPGSGLVLLGLCVFVAFVVMTNQRRKAAA